MISWRNSRSESKAKATCAPRRFALSLRTSFARSSPPSPDLRVLKTWSTRKVTSRVVRDRGPGDARASYRGLRAETAVGGRLLRAFWRPAHNWGQPMQSMHSGSLALGGLQANSSSVQRGPLPAKAAPEPNTYRHNLRSRGSHELGPIGRNMQASVSLRPLLGILAERTGLIAKKGPPRRGWPSAWCWQVARHGGLGDAEPEHENFAMDPRRTPEKIFTSHPCDQIADLTGDPGAPTSPATT